MDVISIINPNHTMAPEYMKDLLEMCSKGGSVIVSDPKGGLSQAWIAGPELKDAIEKTDKNLSARFRCYFATDEHKEKEDRQPFAIVEDAKGKPLVYALVGGKFEKYETETATCGPEATFVEEWLANKVQAIWAGTTGDNAQRVKKLFQLLDTNKFKAEVQEEMGSPSVIALINNEEAPFWITKGNADNAGKFTWGECSDKLTYEEPKAKAAEPAGGSKIDWANMTFKEKKIYRAAHPDFDPEKDLVEPAKTDKPVADPPDPKAKPSVPSVVPDGVELEKATDQGSIGIKKGKRYLFPPINLNDEDLKKFYPKHAGGSAKEYDWKNRVGIPIEKLQKSSHFFAMVHGPAVKDTDVHGQITKVDRILLTGPEIGEAFTLINKNTGYATMKELEDTFTDDHPSFTKRLGKTLDSWSNLFRLPEGELLKLSHKALASLCHELRAAYIKDHPAAFGQTQVIVADKKDDAKPEPEKKEELVDGLPANWKDLTFKEKKAWRADHPEAASAA